MKAISKANRNSIGIQTHTNPQKNQESKSNNNEKSKNQKKFPKSNIINLYFLI